MSDSNFAAVSRFQNFLEVIDDRWIVDSLSDDGKFPILVTCLATLLYIDG